MQYRKDKYGNQISILGYGCMRFSRRAGLTIFDKAEAEVMQAIKAGVNYFDTAYIYPGSESTLGEILAKNHCRDQVYITSKLPHYMIKSVSGMEKTFQEQLKRLKTDHIDYYLMHMLTDTDTWQSLVDLGIVEWLAAKKAEGSIRQVGFSYHGHTDMFLKLLPVYDWDICMIQYNYMDEFSQGGRRGLEAAAAMGLPVVIMEPLRGGRLVNLLPAKAKEVFQSSERGWSPAEWALRWLWDQPELTCVLSGMNSAEMIAENVRVANDTKINSLTEADFQLLAEVKTAINASIRVNCTGCAYCMPCPKGVDIPGTFRCYNALYTESRYSGWRDYFQTTLLRRNQSGANLCVGCGLCEKHCPQAIPIREELAKARHDLEILPYKIAGKLVKIFKLW
jgi:predicted aldo/keto reductase-like oxidoreductase